jgi:hypothetical protein
VAFCAAGQSKTKSEQKERSDWLGQNGEPRGWDAGQHEIEAEQTEMRSDDISQDLVSD